MFETNDFVKFAKSNGVNEIGLDKYRKMTAGYINPTILEERQLNVTQMDVFSRLMMEKIIFLGTSINADVANIVNAQMLYLSSLGDEDITININSPGGEVYSGMSIIDTMNFIQNEIQTVCMGMAASMGAVILSCGEKGKRGALPHSRVMIHQPLGGAHGQASDILIEAEQIKLVKEELCRILAEKSGQPYEKVVEDCDRDHWLTANEALEYGLIDTIYTKKQ